MASLLILLLVQLCSLYLKITPSFHSLPLEMTTDLFPFLALFFKAEQAKLSYFSTVKQKLCCSNNSVGSWFAFVLLEVQIRIAHSG